MYRIRLHGRGGQGIKTGGQILGSAFFLEGYEVQDAPRYGAERRGAPIFAYVRADRAPVQERGVITRPDLVVVADETLVPMPAAAVTQGLHPRTVFLVVSDEPGPVWRDRLTLAGPVLTLPLGGDPAQLGARCAGAAAALVGAIGRERLAQAVRDEVGRFGEGLVATALAQALAAFDAMLPHAGLAREAGEVAAGGYARPDWIEIPFDRAVVSAPDIHAAATSELARTGTWRTMRPVIDLEHCHRCSWICSTLCPDSAIRVRADRSPEVDTEHCKGCMICVAVCPTHAIRAVPEREAAT